MQEERETKGEALVWKDILKHEDTLEAQRFWACFQFLFIMRPKHGRDGDQAWMSLSYKLKYNEEKKRWESPTSHYEPQCRYDEFVASHSTCCEHANVEFSYYHRNLMSKFNLALNEADYILRTPSHADMKWVENKCEEKHCSKELKDAV